MTCPICPRSGPRLTPTFGRLPLTFVADALGAESTADGKMMVGGDAHLLARQLTRLGLTWRDVGQTATCWSYPRAALRHMAALTCTCGEADLTARTGHFFVTLGDGAFERLTGLKLPEHLRRGYVFPERFGRGWVLPVLSPKWYRQDPQLLLLFILDVQKAVRLCQSPFAYESVEALWQPSLERWDALVRDFLADPRRPLAADIETPWKRRSEMSEEEKASDEDISYQIDEVNLAWGAMQGVSVPWAEAYQPGVRAIIEASQRHGTTLFWNKAYDVPRLEGAGFAPFDTRRTIDTMDAWHCLYNALPRRLVMASSALSCNDHAKPWKHLGTDDPFYRAMDVIALWRNDAEIQQRLVATGQARSYELFFTKLDPLLAAMTDAGVKVDQARVEAAATEGREQLAAVTAAMTAAVPPAALNVQVWKKRSAAEAGLVRLVEAGEVLPGAALEPVAATRRAKQCSRCGAIDVTKPHVTKKTIGGV